MPVTDAPTRPRAPFLTTLRSASPVTAEKTHTRARTPGRDVFGAVVVGDSEVDVYKYIIIIIITPADIHPAFVRVTRTIFVQTRIC